MLRNLACYVDHRVKGAKPGHLPTEQPMRLEIVLGSKSAKLLGVEFPPVVPACAERVIEWPGGQRLGLVVGCARPLEAAQRLRKPPKGSPRGATENLSLS